MDDIRMETDEHGVDLQGIQSFGVKRWGEVDLVADEVEDNMKMYLK
jgi:hypothetical protein